MNTNTNTYSPTAADRRRWNKEDGQGDGEALAQAAAELSLSLNHAIVAGKPMARVIEVPASFSPVSALTAIGDLMGDDAGDKITAEMLGIIGAMAAKPNDELGARAAAWVESVSKAFGRHWAEALADEWAENGHEVTIPATFRLEPVYQAAMDETMEASA